MLSDDDLKIRGELFYRVKQKVKHPLYRDDIGASICEVADITFQRLVRVFRREVDLGRLVKEQEIWHGAFTPGKVPV